MLANDMIKGREREREREIEQIKQQKQQHVQCTVGSKSVRPQWKSKIFQFKPGDK